MTSAKWDNIKLGNISVADFAGDFIDESVTCEESWKGISCTRLVNTRITLTFNSDRARAHLLRRINTACVKKCMRKLTFTARGKNNIYRRALLRGVGANKDGSSVAWFTADA